MERPKGASQGDRNAKYKIIYMYIKYPGDIVHPLQDFFSACSQSFLCQNNSKNLLLIRTCSLVFLRPGQDADLVYVHHQCSPAPHGR